VSDVDWDIAHNLYTSTIAMRSKFFPLSKKFELRKFVYFYLGRQSGSPFRKDRGVSSSNSRLPVHPSHILVNSLARHEDSVIVQPFGVALAKSLESANFSRATILKERPPCFVQQTLFEVDHARVLDVLLRKARGIR
jgi:hypothetical protein